jgi:Tfp pilus assembly protein PilF
MDDIFALQDKITRKIVTALAIKLTANDQSHLGSKKTDSIEAYDAYLQGMKYYSGWTPEDFAKAVGYFRKAIELDPDYSKPYAALASIYRTAFLSGQKWLKTLNITWINAGDLVLKYLKAALKNPTPLAYQVSSEKNLFTYRDCTKAINEAEKAIALDSNDPNGYTAMARAFVYSGKCREAIELMRKAMRMDPHYPAYYLFILGTAHFGMDQFKEAARLFKRATERSPESCRWYHWLGATYSYLGKVEEANGALDKCSEEDLGMGIRVVYYERRMPFVNPVDLDRFLNGLRKAGMPEY